MSTDKRKFNRPGTSIYSDEQIAEMRHLLAEGATLREVARITGASITYVGKIKANRSRAGVGVDASLAEPIKQTKYSDDDIRAMREMFANGRTLGEVAEAFGTNREYARLVKGNHIRAGIGVDASGVKAVYQATRRKSDYEVLKATVIDYLMSRDAHVAEKLAKLVGLPHQEPVKGAFLKALGVFAQHPAPQTGSRDSEEA